MFTRVSAFLATVALALTLGPTGPANAAPRGPIEPIGPGTAMVTGRTVCTAGLVFTDARKRVFVAYPAACARTDRTPARLGTPVRFTNSEGRTIGRGVLRYSSTRAVRKNRAHPRANHRAGNFALVQVRGRTARAVNPTVPVWGGPTALGALPSTGAQVFSLGTSGSGSPAPRAGTVQETQGPFASVTTAPLLATDAGAPVLDAEGRAVALVTTPGSSTAVTGLTDQVAFAATHGMPGLRLVPGHAGFARTAVY